MSNTSNLCRFNVKYVKVRHFIVKFDVYMSNTDLYEFNFKYFKVWHFIAKYRRNLTFKCQIRAIFVNRMPNMSKVDVSLSNTH